MKTLVATLALAVAITTPVFIGSAAGQTANKEKTAKRVPNEQVRVQKRVYSPYSSDPSYDVYVNGTYIGSDPDPRIRWTLKKEYCEDSLDGC